MTRSGSCATGSSVRSVGAASVGGTRPGRRCAGPIPPGASWRRRPVRWLPIVRRYRRGPRHGWRVRQRGHWRDGVAGRARSPDPPLRAPVPARGIPLIRGALAHRSAIVTTRSSALRLTAMDPSTPIGPDAPRESANGNAPRPAGACRVLMIGDLIGKPGRQRSSRCCPAFARSGASTSSPPTARTSPAGWA